MIDRRSFLLETAMDKVNELHGAFTDMMLSEYISAAELRAVDDLADELAGILAELVEELGVEEIE